MAVKSTISDGITNARFHGVPFSGLSDATALLNTMLTNAGTGAYVRIPPGTYLISSGPVTPLSGQTIDLTTATLTWPTNTTLTGMIDIDGKSNVTIFGGTLDGNVANQSPWSEFKHCIRIRDSDHITIKTRILNPIGDGVYVSHAAGASAPYTGSSDIDLDLTCIGTNVNRNGVSLICGRRIKVRGYYYGMSRADEPGAIDLEPNDANDFLIDIVVDHPIIDGGPGSVIPEHGIQLANSTAGANMDNILIDAPVIRGKFLRGIRLRGHASVQEKGLAIRSPQIRNVLPGNAAENYGIRFDDIAAELSNPDIDGVEGVGIYQIRSDLKISNSRINNCSVAGYKQGNAADLIQLLNAKVWQCGIGLDLRSTNQTYLDFDISAAPLWAINTAYLAGNLVRTTTNKLLRVTVAGTSAGATEPNPAAIGDSAVDNTVTWKYDADTQAMATGVLFNAGTGNKLRGKVTNATTSYSGTAAQTFLTQPSVSADNGDAAKTLVTLVDETTQRWATPLTAARAVTLSTTNVHKGAQFRIVRTAAATGAFNLNVGTGPLKALATAGLWCEVTYDGSAWVLTANGAL